MENFQHKKVNYIITYEAENIFLAARSTLSLSLSFAPSLAKTKLLLHTHISSALNFLSFPDYIHTTRDQQTQTGKETASKKARTRRFPRTLFEPPSPCLCPLFFFRYFSMLSNRL